MQGERLFDRILAVLALAVGALSLSASWMAYSMAGTEGGAGSGQLLSSLRIAAFVLGAIACVVCAARLWSSPPSSQARTKALRFGRNAGPGAEVSRPRFLLFVLPVLVFGALAADYFAPWHGPAQDIAAAPPGAGDAAANPPADEPLQPPVELPQPPAATPPQPPPESPGSPDLVTAPDPVAPQPDPVAPVAPVDPVEPPVEAVLPPPPQTVAPLPTPPQLATRADGHQDAVVWLAVSPDNRTLLSASTDHAIKLWDMDGVHLIRNLGTHKDMARVALFLPDGLRALTCGDDGEIVLRQLSDGTVLHVFSATQHGGTNEVMLSRDGRIAVSGHVAGTVIVWDIENKAILHVMSGHNWPIASVAISPDATKAVTGSIDGELRLWDIKSGRLIRSWLGHERGTYGSAFTPDGSQIYTGSGDYLIKLWDVATGKELRRYEGHSGTVYALELSADGSRLLSGSLDGTARLWDVASGNEIAQFNGHRGAVYSVAFAPDGSILTGGNDRTIRRWKASGGQSEVLFAGAPQ